MGREITTKNTTITDMEERDPLLSFGFTQDELSSV